MPLDEQFKELKKDFYHFNDEQISRNTACDLQLEHHDKEIDDIKEKGSKCQTEVLPGMRKDNNKLLGVCATLGIVFAILFYSVRSTASDVKEISREHNDLSKVVVQVQESVKHIRSDNMQIKDDVKEIHNGQQALMLQQQKQDIILRQILDEIK